MLSTRHAFGVGLLVGLGWALLRYPGALAIFLIFMLALAAILGFVAYTAIGPGGVMAAAGGLFLHRMRSRR